MAPCSSCSGAGDTALRLAQGFDRSFVAVTFENQSKMFFEGGKKMGQSPFFQPNRIVTYFNSLASGLAEQIVGSSCQAVMMGVCKIDCCHLLLYTCSSHVWL